jgi:hypothetical protein
MKAIFLSASVPDPRRNPKYHSSADLVAIRDAVRALAAVVLPHATLYWGGHPAITPLISVVARSTDLTGEDRVRVYQSEWFPAEQRPTENDDFERVVLTPRRETLEESLYVMRESMLSAAPFEAAIFIGGMEGVEEEFDSFRRINPKAAVLPVASTGGAAGLLFKRERQRLGLSDDLLSEYAYPTLFRRHLRLPTVPGAG